MPNTLANYLHLDQPPTNTLPDVVSWICSRPGHARQAGSRALTVNPGKVALVRETESKKPASFLLVGRAAQTYFKRSAGGYQQWGLILSEPSSEAAYVESQTALKSALEAAAGNPVVLNLRATTDLRFSRYYADYHEPHPVFPQLFDYSQGGDFNNAPPLDDVSKISSRSLIAVAFTVKTYDQAKVPNREAPSSPGHAGEAPTTPPATKRKAAARGKKNKEDEDEAAVDTTESDKSEKVFGCRLEFSAVWWLGRDDEDLLEGSPTKAPKF